VSLKLDGMASQGKVRTWGLRSRVDLLLGVAMLMDRGRATAVVMEVLPTRRFAGLQEN